MNPNADPPQTLEMLTVGEIAERLGLSRSHTYELVMSGRIKSVKIGRCRRVSTAALAAFIRELEVMA